MNWKTTSPYSSSELKKAKELLPIICEQLDSDTGMEPEKRKELELQRATLLGIIWSPWLPEGTGRRILMAALCFIGIFNAVLMNIFWLLLVILALVFSPRIMSRVLLWKGKLEGKLDTYVERNEHETEVADVVLLFMIEQMRIGITEKEQLVENVHKQWCEPSDPVENVSLLVDKLYPYALSAIQSQNE
jgi:hypothetical protein